MYFPFFDKATGNASAYTNTSINVNPSTGVVSATGFSGAGTSLTSLTATNINGTVATANVSLYDSVTEFTTNQTFYPQFSNIATTGNSLTGVSSSLSYNPSTGALSSTSFNGVGTFSTATTSGTFIGSGNIVAASGTASTSATTGALVVAGTGGLAVGGNTFHARSTIMNSSQTAGMDTIIRGVNDSTLIWARPNATYDSVIIGNSAVAGNAVVGAKLIINTTDSMILPGGTNAQRPSSIGGTDVAGMFRYNITSNNLEFYNGAEWKAPSGAFTVIAGQQFTGDGSTTTFTLSEASTTAATIVAINGVVQIPGLSYAYTVSDTTLTFSEAPATGDIIDARTLTTTAQVSGIGSTTGFTNIAADTDATGIVFKTGTAAASTVFTMPPGGGIVSNDANVSVASANTPTTIDTITNATYRSAKYIVQVTNGANFQSSEALVVQDGTAATIVVYGTVQTNSNLGVLSAAVSGGNTLVQFTSVNATNTVRIFKQYIPL
jgi:hypothetical protein